MALALAAAVLALFLPATGHADDRRGAGDAIAVFAGQATRTNFVESIYMPWTNDMQDIGVIGAMYSHRLGTVGDIIGDGLPFDLGQDLTIEAEAGTSLRFGDEGLGEGWVGLFLRYDDFPWNDTVFTTIAVNTGVSLLTEESEFERSRDSKGRNARLLHYMGPEITFADPDNKNLELLFRFHHRSGVFGLFDGVVSGSTFISSGVRYRF